MTDKRVTKQKEYILNIREFKRSFNGHFYCFTMSTIKTIYSHKGLEITREKHKQPY